MSLIYLPHGTHYQAKLQKKIYFFCLTRIFFISLIAMPLTFLEVSAAGNTDRLKDTIIDKSIQKFEDSFNSFLRISNSLLREELPQIQTLPY